MPKDITLGIAFTDPSLIGFRISTTRSIILDEMTRRSANLVIQLWSLRHHRINEFCVSS